MKKAFAAFLITVLGLAGCVKSEKPAPVVTPATSQDVLRAVHDPAAKVVLVNMWASWCGPCRQEFPDLVKAQRELAPQGLKVVLVSWDDTTNEAAFFLAKQGVTTPSFIKAKSQGDEEFMAAISTNWQGNIPATFIYDSSGKLRDFWEGPATYADFTKKVKEAMVGK